MHKSPNEAVQFFKDFLPKFEQRGGKKMASGPNGGPLRTVFFVPALDLFACEQVTRGSGVEIGGQNIHHEIKGAFTGENSAAVLASIGASWALVGHSERRSLFGETDVMTDQKMKTAVANGLSAMLCVGETLQEREADQTLRVVTRQLEAGLAGVLDVLRATPKRIAIAYEPVWAIGTGKVATPDQASEVHQSIRAWLNTKTDAKVAAEIAILYGGSVKPDNAKAIGSKPDIDGFLVGGASLEVDSFLGLF